MRFSRSLFAEVRLCSPVLSALLGAARFPGAAEGREGSEAAGRAAEQAAPLRRPSHRSLHRGMELDARISGFSGGHPRSEGSPGIKTFWKVPFQ